jgi:hypothetical protein
MADSKFQAFVPPEVQGRIRHLRLIRSVPSLAQELAVFEKLCVHPNMETVWGRLSKRKVVLEDDWVTKNHLWLYVSFIPTALKRGAWDYLSPSERTAKIQDINSDLRKLSRNLKKFSIFENVLELFSDEELLNIMHLNEDLHVNPDFFKNAYPLPLHQIIERCVSVLEEYKPFPGITLQQPNRVNADFIYFVRTFANWNFNIYGTPLHEINALVTDIFYPNQQVNEKKIQNILRGYDYRHPFVLPQKYTF